MPSFQQEFCRGYKNWLLTHEVMALPGLSRRSACCTHRAHITPALCSKKLTPFWNAVFGNSFPVCAWTSSTRAPTLINIKEVKYAFYSWERSLFLWFLLPWHLLPTHWVMCAVSSDNTGSQKGRLCEQSTGPEPPHSSGIPFQQACVFTPHPGVRVSGRPLGTPGGWGTES